MLIFSSQYPLTRERAFRTVAFSGAAGAVLGAAHAFFNRDKEDSAGDAAKGILGSAGRGAALGIAGGLGALAYGPIARHLEGAFSYSRLGRISRAAVCASTQGALIGLGIGGYRALVPHNEHWAEQPVSQRARTFVPADIKSWASTGLLLGLLARAVGFPKGL